MVAASMACVLAGGTYWYYYHNVWYGNILPPGNMPGLKINPPVLHNGNDSIAPQDSVHADTVEIISCE